MRSLLSASILLLGLCAGWNVGIESTFADSLAGSDPTFFFVDR